VTVEYVRMHDPAADLTGPYNASYRPGAPAHTILLRVIPIPALR